jgi:hypothetical protein
MNEIENPQKTNILKQYEDLSPINLVDTVERYYHTFLPNQDKESLNILSSYKTKNNVKFQLLDFEHKKKTISTTPTKDKKYSNNENIRRLFFPI